MTNFSPLSAGSDRILNAAWSQAAGSSSSPALDGEEQERGAPAHSSEEPRGPVWKRHACSKKMQAQAAEQVQRLMEMEVLVQPGERWKENDLYKFPRLTLGKILTQFQDSLVAEWNYRTHQKGWAGYPEVAPRLAIYLKGSLAGQAISGEDIVRKVTGEPGLGALDIDLTFDGGGWVPEDWVFAQWAGFVKRASLRWVWSLLNERPPADATRGMSAGDEDLLFRTFFAGRVDVDEECPPGSTNEPSRGTQGSPEAAWTLYKLAFATAHGGRNSLDLVGVFRRGARPFLTPDASFEIRTPLNNAPVEAFCWIAPKTALGYLQRKDILVPALQQLRRGALEKVLSKAARGGKVVGDAKTRVALVDHFIGSFDRTSGRNWSQDAQLRLEAVRNSLVGEETDSLTAAMRLVVLSLSLIQIFPYWTNIEWWPEKEFWPLDIQPAYDLVCGLEGEERADCIRFLAPWLSARARQAGLVRWGKLTAAFLPTWLEAPRRGLLRQAVEELRLSGVHGEVDPCLLFSWLSQLTQSQDPSQDALLLLGLLEALPTTSVEVPEGTVGPLEVIGLSVGQVVATEQLAALCLIRCRDPHEAVARLQRWPALREAVAGVVHVQPRAYLRVPPSVLLGNWLEHLSSWAGLPDLLSRCRADEIAPEGPNGWINAIWRYLEAQLKARRPWPQGLAAQVLRNPEAMLPEAPEVLMALLVEEELEPAVRSRLAARLAALLPSPISDGLRGREVRAWLSLLRDEQVSLRSAVLLQLAEAGVAGRWGLATRQFMQALRPRLTAATVAQSADTWYAVLSRDVHADQPIETWFPPQALMALSWQQAMQHLQACKGMDRWTSAEDDLLARWLDDPEHRTEALALCQRHDWPLNAHTRWMLLLRDGATLERSEQTLLTWLEELKAIADRHGNPEGSVVAEIAAIVERNAESWAKPKGRRLLKSKSGSAISVLLDVAIRSEEHGHAALMEAVVRGWWRVASSQSQAGGSSSAGHHGEVWLPAGVEDKAWIERVLETVLAGEVLEGISAAVPGWLARVDRPLQQRVMDNLVEGAGPLADELRRLSPTDRMLFWTAVVQHIGTAGGGAEVIAAACGLLPDCDVRSALRADELITIPTRVLCGWLMALHVVTREAKTPREHWLCAALLTLKRTAEVRPFDLLAKVYTSLLEALRARATSLGMPEPGRNGCFDGTALAEVHRHHWRGHSPLLVHEPSGPDLDSVLDAMVTLAMAFQYSPVDLDHRAVVLENLTPHDILVVSWLVNDRLARQTGPVNYAEVVKQYGCLGAGVSTMTLMQHCDIWLKAPLRNHDIEPVVEFLESSEQIFGLLHFEPDDLLRAYTEKLVRLMCRASLDIPLDQLGRHGIWQVSRRWLASNSDEMLSDAALDDLRAAHDRLFSHIEEHLGGVNGPAAGPSPLWSLLGVWTHLTFIASKNPAWLPVVDGAVERLIDMTCHPKCRPEVHLGMRTMVGIALIGSLGIRRRSDDWAKTTWLMLAITQVLGSLCTLQNPWGIHPNRLVERVLDGVEAAKKAGRAEWPLYEMSACFWTGALASADMLTRTMTRMSHDAAIDWAGLEPFESELVELIADAFRGCRLDVVGGAQQPWYRAADQELPGFAKAHVFLPRVLLEVGRAMSRSDVGRALWCRVLERVLDEKLVHATDPRLPQSGLGLAVVGAIHSLYDLSLQTSKQGKRVRDSNPQSIEHRLLIKALGKLVDWERNTGPQSPSLLSWLAADSLRGLGDSKGKQAALVTPTVFTIRDPEWLAQVEEALVGDIGVFRRLRLIQSLEGLAYGMDGLPVDVVTRLHELLEKVTQKFCAEVSGESAAAASSSRCSEMTDLERSCCIMMFCDFWRWNPSSRRCGRAFLGHLQRWADGGADAVRVAKALVQDLQRQPINAEHIQDVEALAALRHPGIREDLRKLVDGWEQRLRDRKRNSTEYAQIRRARSAIFALLDEALERS